MPASNIPSPAATQTRTIVCSVCRAGPLDGVALFADCHDADGRRKLYCPRHLSRSAVQARLERQQNGGRALDADIVAIFERRVESGQ